MARTFSEENEPETIRIERYPGNSFVFMPTGVSVPTLSRNRERRVSADCGSNGLQMKSPGTVRVAPYTNSTDDLLKSSLDAVRIPKKTHGSSSHQLRPVSRPRSEDFSCL